MKKVIVILCLAILLVACTSRNDTDITDTPVHTILKSPETVTPSATGTVTLTPTNTYTPEPTISDTPTGTEEPANTGTSTPNSNCNPGQVIELLKKEVPYETFTLGYQTLNGVRYLFFWIIDTELNPNAQETELISNVDLAITHAIQLSHELNQADPCVPELFDAFNPVVVDENYNGWFSGVINIADLPQTKTITDDEIEAIKRAIPSEYLWKRTTIPDIQSIPPGSCSWHEVLENVSRHFWEGPLNTYILVADDNGVTFTIQYQARTKEDEIVVFLNTAREVACLQPAVDQILVILVDGNGNVFSARYFPLAP